MNETPETITAWANETFGPDVCPLACAVRANLEMAELLAAVTQGQLVINIAEECADVCIPIWRLLLLLDAKDKHYNYGGLTLKRSVTRANTAMAALITALGPEPPAVQCGEAWEEPLMRLTGLLRQVFIELDMDMQASINRKMQINRARQWTRDGTGCGFHVKTTA